jgi:hypothetical protein
MGKIIYNEERQKLVLLANHVSLCYLVIRVPGYRYRGPDSIQEWGPLNLMSTIEELLERKSSGSGLENRKYGIRDLSIWQRGTLYPQIWN